MITHINIVYLCGDVVALIGKKEQFGGQMAVMKLIHSSCVHKVT